MMNDRVAEAPPPGMNKIFTRGLPASLMAPHRKPGYTATIMKDRRGLILAFSGYLLWGFFPLYWGWLREVTAAELLAHRALWSMILIGILLTWQSGWGTLKESLRSSRTVRLSLITSLLISVNWGLYLWAVTHGRVLAGSLGYFINPIFSVLLGVVFLGERLRLLQKVAVVCATIGCLIMVFSVGEFPWIALTLAATFATYGYLRKTMPLGSVNGMAVETSVLSLPALVFLFWLDSRGELMFRNSGLLTQVLLAGAGVVTAVPLLLFTEGARRIPLSTLGLLQYVAPTTQFLLGVFYFYEPFSTPHFIAFLAIWIGLAFFSMDAFSSSRTMPVMPPE